MSHKTAAAVEHRGSRHSRGPSASKDKKVDTRADSTTSTEAKAKEAHTFHADDFNFTGYDLPQLVFLCEHKLVLRTRFPKLVVALYHHPCFAACTAFRQIQRDVTALRQLLVARLVDAIARRTACPGLDGAGPKRLTLNDELCNQLVHEVIGADDMAVTSGGSQTKPDHPPVEPALLQEPRGGRTMKQVHSHQWTDYTHPHLELEVVTSRGSRTRKRPVGPTTASATAAVHAPHRSESRGDSDAPKQGVDTPKQRVIQI